MRYARSSGPRKIVILLGNGAGIGAERGPRDALVQAKQAAGPDRRELLRRRLVLDDDGDRPEPFGELRRERLEGVE